MQVGMATAIRPQRRDAVENRKRVLDAARQLFEANGVDSVTMDQVAKAAGVGPGTLYRQYANKGDLCEDLLRRSLDNFRTGVERYLAEFTEKATPTERLASVISWLVTFTERNWRLLGAIGDAATGRNRDGRYRQAHYRWMHDTMTRLIREASNGGRLNQVDPTYVADTILAALSPDLYQFQRTERAFSIQQIERSLVRIFAEA